MFAERLILETDMAGRLKAMPKLPPNTRLEAIFLEFMESPSSAPGGRKPHPDLRGSVTILGDIMDSVPASDWDLPS